jgi:hypothetical protein
LPCLFSPIAAAIAPVVLDARSALLPLAGPVGCCAALCHLPDLPFPYVSDLLMQMQVQVQVQLAG